ncbi:hypothetical protein G7Y89_g1652 [Cudoniella acicularis]|uniref:Uncharacterized protein n=1 Tax=Cudoniella acicularis TaxID=354080 RepID=A0A8H4W9C3_9HELO|nr:hypothetical protein G7Y89_g1652 [Cudoniella acicularis]
MSSSFSSTNAYGGTTTYSITATHASSTSNRLNLNLDVSAEEAQRYFATVAKYRPEGPGDDSYEIPMDSDGEKRREKESSFASMEDRQFIPAGPWGEGWNVPGDEEGSSDYPLVSPFTSVENSAVRDINRDIKPTVEHIEYAPSLPSSATVDNSSTTVNSSRPSSPSSSLTSASENKKLPKLALQERRMARLNTSCSSSGSRSSGGESSGITEQLRILDLSQLRRLDSRGVVVNVREVGVGGVKSIGETPSSS